MKDLTGSETLLDISREIVEKLGRESDRDRESEWEGNGEAFGGAVSS